MPSPGWEQCGADDPEVVAVASKTSARETDNILDAICAESCLCGSGGRSEFVLGGWYGKAVAIKKVLAKDEHVGHRDVGDGVDDIAGAEAIDPGLEEVVEIKSVLVSPATERFEQALVDGLGDDDFVWDEQIPEGRFAERAARIAPEGVDGEEIERDVDAGAFCEFGQRGGLAWKVFFLHKADGRHGGLLCRRNALVRNHTSQAITPSEWNHPTVPGVHQSSRCDRLEAVNMRRWMAAVMIATVIAGWAYPARAVESIEIGVDGGAVRSVSPDGRVFAASFPLPSEGGSRTGAIRAFQDDGTPEADADSPRVCFFEVVGGAELSCADFSEIDGWAGGTIAESFSWSTDGSRVVFGISQALRLFVDSDLWMIDVRTGELTNLTDEGFDGPLAIGGDLPAGTVVNVDVAPAFSGTGDRVAFTRWTVDGGDANPMEIAILDLKGGEVEVITRLSDDGFAVGPPIWTADDTRLLFSIRDDGTASGVYQVDVGGSTPALVVGADVEYGAPLLVGTDASGDTLLVLYYETLQRRFDTVYAVVELDPSESTVVGPAMIVDDKQPYYMAALSPDGESVALMQMIPDREEPSGVFAIARADGSEQEILLTDGPDFVFTSNLAAMDWTTGGGVVIPAPGASQAAPWTVIFPEDMSISIPVTPVAGGSMVTVNDDGVVVRAAPNREAIAVMTVDRGTVLDVTGDAVEADGLTWWPVRDPDTLTVGWVRAELVDWPE